MGKKLSPIGGREEALSGTKGRGSHLSLLMGILPTEPTLGGETTPPLLWGGPKKIFGDKWRGAGPPFWENLGGGRRLFSP